MVWLRARYLYFLWILGGAFLFIGVKGDQEKWWAELGYTTNVLAGATAACFGVPIAATVIQWFLREESERARHRDTIIFAKKSLDQIHESLARLNLEYVHPVAGEVDGAARDLQRLRIDQALRHRGDGLAAYVDEVKRAVLNGIDKVEDLGLGVREEVDRELTRATRRWRIVEESTLVQAEVLGITLVSDTTARDISECLREVDVTSFRPLYSAREFCLSGLSERLIAIDTGSATKNEISQHHKGIDQATRDLEAVVSVLAGLQKLWQAVLIAQSDIEIAERRILR